MKTPKYSKSMKPHTMMYPDELWNKIVEESKILSHKFKKYISGSDIVRMAIEKYFNEGTK